MARLPRYFVKGVPLHIILRGNNRDPIFGNDDDYQELGGQVLDLTLKHYTTAWSTARTPVERNSDGGVCIVMAGSSITEQGINPLCPKLCFMRNAEFVIPARKLNSPPDKVVGTQTSRTLGLR
jgi:hypothetical protein